MELGSGHSNSSPITFEWTLSGLKDLFELTKGSQKSTATKSPLFGSNQWQIIFYANAGLFEKNKDEVEGDGSISLYLSAEPTAEEKGAASSSDSLAASWERGLYNLSFELRNIGKDVLYVSKEAFDHSFTNKTPNWGWARFARRDSVYYQAPQVIAQDAILIICTVTSSATSPNRSLHRQLV